MTEARGLRLSDVFIALLFAMGLYALWYIRTIVLLIYVSIIFAVIFTPAVSAITRLRIGRWHPSRGAAILILLAAVLGILALFGLLMLPPIINDIQNLGQELPKRLNHLAARLQQLPLGEKAANWVRPQSVEQHLGAVLKNAFNTAQAFFSGVADLFLTALLVAYFILDGERTFRWAMCLVPARRRERLQETLFSASHRVQRWITGQLLLMLILGSSSFFTFWALGVRYFYALALFAALANFVPILGPIATVIVAGVVAALDSWLKVLGVLIFYFVYQQVENAYLSPRIMQATVDIPAIAVIVALAIGGELAGIWGAIVAVPSAALIATVIDEYMVHCEHPQSELRRAG